MRAGARFANTIVMSDRQSEIDRARDLHRQGAVGEAKRIYEAVLEAEPANADALHLLGVVALQTGDAGRAVDLIGQAIDIDEADAHFHNNLGEAHRTQRDITKALASYRTARALDPAFAPAINNEGAALMALGQVVEAARCFGDAISTDGSYLQAHLNLGIARQAAGDLTGALAALSAARELDLGDLTLLQSYATVAARIPVEDVGKECEPHITAALRRDGINAQRLVRPALRLLAMSDEFNALSNAPGSEIRGGDHDGALENPILLDLLRRTVIANTTAELLLTRLRRLCLNDISHAQGGMARRLPAFAEALAAQCYLTDYAYADTLDENGRLNDLVRDARILLNDGVSDQAMFGAHSSVIAMYRPLGGVFAKNAGLAGLVAEDLLELQIGSSEKEAVLAAAVPSLMSGETDGADPVQQQYEEAPYPRWITCDRRVPTSLANVLGALYPHRQMPEFSHRPVRALVAGCGTGKHAVDVAQQYQTSELVALDISRASLGYAARMADQLGLTNIRFTQADLLGLDDWNERFDVVESAGVLHHLEDPQQGLRILSEKLEPGGFMKIALYSVLGRKAIADARAMVASGPSVSRAARMREARQAIIELPRDDLRRRVTDYTYFYSLRGCRDLLFHVREKAYSILEIASMLSLVDLEFIGFQFSDPNVPARYLEANPTAAPNDLDQWHVFEQSYPDTFSGMYQFWCQKSA